MLMGLNSFCIFAMAASDWAYKMVRREKRGQRKEIGEGEREGKREVSRA